MSTEHLKRGGFAKGVSGNPGGRPRIAKAVETATGKTPSEVSAEMFKLLYEAAHALDPGDKDESASWRFSVGTILGYINGKPKEQIEVSSGAPKVDVSELTDEELEVLAKVRIDGDRATEH